MVVMSEHRWYKHGPLRGHWIAPNRRHRARLWFVYSISRWDDMVGDRGWPERAYAPEWGVLDRLFRLTCRAVGHRVVNDHCGRDVHRYCEICNLGTPGAPLAKPSPDVDGR